MAVEDSNSNAMVSVIIPVYNAGKTLDQCLRSVRGQSHRALDIICLNDGSTDDSLAIMRRHEHEDPRVRVVDKANEGYGATCNRGIELAQGTWIAIVEPDDWIGSDAYDSLLSAAGMNQCVDIIKAPWFEVAETGDGVEVERPCVLSGRLRSASKPFSIVSHPILLRVHPAIWSALYRASYLQKHRIRFREYPGAGWADNPFLIETMCQTSHILYVDIPFYRYRVDNPASSSNDARPEAAAVPFDRWMEMLEIIDRLGVDDEGVLAAHYARGFNYADDARCRFGFDNDLVQERIKRMFHLMDAEIVRGIPYISPARRRAFFRIRGERVPRVPLMGWFAYATREVFRILGSDGPGALARRLLRS